MEAIPSATGESPAADGFFSLSQGRSFDYPDVARIANYRMGDSWRATEPLSVSGVCTHVGNRRSSNPLSVSGVCTHVGNRRSSNLNIHFFRSIPVC